MYIWLKNEIISADRSNILFSFVKLDVSPYFGNQIAGEICLPESVDQKFLRLFRYFGAADTTVDTLKWGISCYGKGNLPLVVLWP
jgi:hypothetical protein